MKIYTVVRTDPIGYDVFDSFVCYTENQESAKDINPDGEWKEDRWRGWIKKDEKDTLKVTYIGEAPEVTEEGIILSSFNAG